jgi:2,3-bisphosphoglycerate-independent phosphoglycerate mutase
MGNSEVGHTNIGAGRVVAMDLGQIDLAIEDGSFDRNAALQAFIATLKETGGTAHLLGLVSDGGVHAMLSHLLAAVRVIAGAGVPVAIHAITDGRDVAPTSAPGYIAQLEAGLPAGARIATVIGRYYAMDRDNRWERVKTAYDAIVQAKGLPVTDAATALRLARERGETDEFVAASVVDGHRGADRQDGLFCLNFRADRAREILEAIANPISQGFDRGEAPALAARLGMVNYSTRHDDWYATAFPQAGDPQHPGRMGGGQGPAPVPARGDREVSARHLLPERRGETPYPGEDRHMAPSPKVATYDLQPEMSAEE